MAVVVDASVAVRWLLDLDGSKNADALLQSRERLIAPDLVFAEISNAIWKSVVFSKTPAEPASEALSRATDFFDEIVPTAILMDRALQIATELRHPVYDCFYLALAEQRDCRMVTADERLLGRCARTPFAKRTRPLATLR